MLSSNSLPITHNAAAAGGTVGISNLYCGIKQLGVLPWFPTQLLLRSGFGDYYDDDRKGRDHENDWIYEDIRMPTELNPEELDV